MRVELLFFFGNKIPRIKVLANSLIIIGAVLLHDLFEGDPLKFQVHVGPLEALQAIRDLGLKLSHHGRLDIVETISILDEAPLCDGICKHVGETIPSDQTIRPPEHRLYPSREPAVPLQTIKLRC